MRRLLSLFAAAFAFLALAAPARAEPQFFSEPIALTLTTASAWTDADVSAICTAGSATGVALRYRNIAQSNHAVGFRKNGSTDGRTQSGGFSHLTMAYIGVDASEIFEYFVGSTTDIQVWVVGCFYGDAYFRTDAIDVSTANTAVWEDVDVDSLDANCTGAAGAYVEHVNTVSTTDGWGIRKNGSTDNRVSAGHDPRHGWATIGVDAGAIFEQQIEGTEADLFLVGCQLTNATFSTDAVDDNLGSAGAYTDLTAVSAGSLAAIYEVTNTGATLDYGFRRNGISENIQQRSRSNGHAWATVGVDAGGIAEGSINDAAIDFWQIGYYSPDVEPPVFIDKLGESFDGNGGAERTTATVSVTPEAVADSIVLAAVTARSSADFTIGCTLDGTPMTLAVANVGAPTTPRRYEVWYTLDPAVSTQDLVCTYSQSPDGDRVSVYQFSGVGAVNAIAVASQTSQTPAVQLRTQGVNSLVFGGFFFFGPAGAPFTPGGVDVVELADARTGATSFDHGYWDAYRPASGVGDYILDAQASVSNFWVMAALELRAPADPGEPGTGSNLLALLGVGGSAIGAAPPPPPPDEGPPCTIEVAAGTTVSAINAIIASAPTDSYICLAPDQALNIASTINMNIQTRNLTLDGRGTVYTRSGSSAVVSMSGDLAFTSAVTGLTYNSGTLTTVITSAGLAPNVAVGDWVKLAADDDLPGGRHGTSGQSATSRVRLGQALQITSKSGNNLTAAGQILYYAADYDTNLRAAKFVSRQGVVRDIRVVTPGGDGGTIFAIQDTVEPLVERLSCDGNASPCVNLGNTVRAVALDLDCRDLLQNSNNTNFCARPNASIGVQMRGFFGDTLRHTCDGQKASIAANTANLGAYGGAFAAECTDSFHRRTNTSGSAFAAHSELQFSLFERVYCLDYGSLNCFSGRGLNNTWRNSVALRGSRGIQIFEENGVQDDGRRHLIDNVLMRELTSWAYYDSGTPLDNRVCNSHLESYGTVEASNDQAGASCTGNPAVSVVHFNTVRQSNVASDTNTWTNSGNAPITTHWFAGRGTDTITAFGQNRIIAGGQGNDTITTSAGRRDRIAYVCDTGVCSTDEGSDTVNGFQEGLNGTIIDLQLYLARAARVDIVNRPGFNPFDSGDDAAGYVRTTQSGGDCLLQLDATGNANGAAWVTVATLNGVTCSNIVYANNNGQTDNWRVRLRN